MEFIDLSGIIQNIHNAFAKRAGWSVKHGSYS